MNLKIMWPVILAFAGVAILEQFIGSPQWIFYATMLSSAIGLGTQVDFEALANRYIAAGHLASTTSSLVGASGVKHRFDFEISREDGVVQVVADTVLSVAEVDEVAVLKFFTKVYDVKPRAAVLCVSPRLSRGAADLAREYKLFVIEQEKPNELIPTLAKTVDKIIGMS